MALKIEMLRAFCTVAKAGNLATAAGQLGRTPSALSMTLKQLETHLGGALFESDRKTRLTALGEQVLALGQTQLRYFDATVREIELAASAPQGVLRVAAVPSVAALSFPTLVSEMRKRHPRLKIELRDADSGQVLEALSQGWADIGIASTEQDLREVTAQPLFQDRFGVVMAADHPLAGIDGPTRLKQVFAHPVLRNALCDRIENTTFRAHLSGTDITVHNTQSLLAMVRTGAWVTVLPQSITALAPDGLAFRPIDDLTELRHVHLYCQTRGFSAELITEAAGIFTSLDWPGAA